MLKKAFNDFVFLYEREGKAQTNFALTMPSDGYDFALQFAKCYANVEVQFAENSSRMAKDEVPQRIAAMSGSFRLKEVVWKEKARPLALRRLA